MIFPNNFEDKIGFDIIRNMLERKCLGATGRQHVSNIQFSSDFNFLSSELMLTEEFRNMLLNVFGFPASEYFDLSEEMLQIQIQGSLLPTEILVMLHQSYSVFTDCIVFLQNLPKEKFPQIIKLITPYYTEPVIIRNITRVIEPDGRIRDNASPTLFSIRKEMSQTNHLVDKRVNLSLNQAKQEGWIAADTEIVIRNGHAVIPINAANKRKIQGVVIDESASGQTSYIEPVQVLELLNRYRELELAEKREITRILIELADQLRPHIPHLNNSFRFLGRLDFLRTKALLAIETNSLLPRLSPDPAFTWIQARHPLLMLALKKQNREVVPADISINAEQRILIISGPNAGGKSVCLKTTGLLQYMLQCGLLIPVLDSSDAGIFNQMFIDIGDQQSIENDLSTYSSHLVNMRTLLEKADTHTLFLIDEFGSGTEPQSGGAIAEAILEELGKKNARGLVTTHYANLKQLASNHQGFVNAAMLYDTRIMHPLYILKIGKPGSSFAFEIAASIQLPQHVLEQAELKIGSSQLDFDKQMQDLEAEKVEIERKEKQLLKADEMLAELVTKYTAQQDNLNRKKNEILENARIKAQEIIARSNQIIEKTIREIKQSQADSAKTKQLREKINQIAEELEKPIPIQTSESQPQPKKETTTTVLNTPISIGSKVRIIGQQEIGEVLEIHSKEATVIINAIRLKIPIAKLEAVDANQPIKKAINRGLYYQNMINDMNARMANFRLTIDVRGKRAEETETLLQKYIDEAVMLHVPEVSILHGKGNGILRNVVRNYLASIPEVKRFSDAPVEIGGAGITIVYLKF